MDIKKEIIEKYDKEATEIDNNEWLNLGNSVRVPERKAAYYFIDRKINESIKLINNDFNFDENILEIGCSFGQMTSLLAQKYKKVTAVDISPKSIEIARKRVIKYGINNIDFVVDDAESLYKIEDNNFNLIFSFSTIRFCANPDLALQSIKRKLKPNGITIIDFPNKYSPWHIFLKSVLRIKKHEHDNLYTEKYLRSLFNQNGFKVEKVKTFLFSSRRLPSYLMPIFKVVDYIFERIPIINKLGAIIMIKAKV